MASASWIAFIIALCVALNVAAGKHHRAKVHLIANSTKSASGNGKAEAVTTAPTKPTTTTPRRTPPPPPPPPKSCDDEGKCAEKNKKCNAESKCICDVQFREISDGSCVPKPQFGESCFDNVTWLECYGQGVDVNCNSQEGANHGTCVCAKGFEASKGDKNCAPITKKLGEACTHDAECYIAYSACTKGKCSCAEGFSAGEGGTCKPKEFRCPTGEPKKGKSGPATCEVDFNGETGEIGDNCGAGHFCFVPPHTLSNVGKPRGHCCPTPSKPEQAQLVCPYGEPLANASCPDKKSDKAPSKPAGNPCPQYSHQCFAVQQRPHDMICCPSPCRQSVSHFDYNGQCFDYVILGHACELAAQCTGDAECSDAGGRKTCQCKKGFTQTEANRCEEA